MCVRKHAIDTFGGYRTKIDVLKALRLWVDRWASSLTV